MQLGSLKDRFPCFTRLNPCVAHCSTDSIPWVHHSREEGSLDYDGGFVHLQVHMNFDTNIHRQKACTTKQQRGPRCTFKLGSRRALVPEGVFVQDLRKPSIKLLDPDSPDSPRHNQTPAPPRDVLMSEMEDDWRKSFIDFNSTN
jgi:hypothetical protein